MKFLKSGLSVAAAFSVAAGLLVAPPAQAAVKLPAGCEGDGSSSAAEVWALSCDTLADGADFSVFTNLEHLTIGDPFLQEKSKAKITSLPKLPASLESLDVTAPKLKDFSTLSSARNLVDLDISRSAAQPSFASLAKWNTKLEAIDLFFIQYANPDTTPLAKLKNLKKIRILGQTAERRVKPRTWFSITLPKDLQGKLIMPTNNYDSETKQRTYTYDAAKKKIRLNGTGGGYLLQSDYKSTKPTTAQPRLRSVEFEFWTGGNMDQLSDWALDPKMKLVTHGTPRIGKTVTAGLSDTSNPFKQYIDAYQWYRNGKAIPGARKASYKLTKADLGKKIQVKATDNKMGFGFSVSPYMPYSVTKTVTPKAGYGFTIHRPSIAGTTLPGKKLSAKFTRWGGSPTRYTYQWYRNGKAIKGATRSTYKATNSDKGRKLTVKVTGSRKNHVTASSTSAATSVSKLAAVGRPGIKATFLGTDKSGKNLYFGLTASKGRWNLPATSYRYQWYRNGKAVKGATKNKYVAKSGVNAHTKFSVRVTARSKYGTVSSTSGNWSF